MEAWWSPLSRELHAQVIPRCATEPPERRRLPAWCGDCDAAPQNNPETHAGLRGALRMVLPGLASSGGLDHNAWRLTLPPSMLV